MDIRGVSSGSSADFRSFRASSQMRNLKNPAVLSLLPSPSRSPSGLGLDRGIYDAVAKQSQGLFAGGRAAMNAANAVLGIDMSQSSSRKAAAEAAAAEAAAAKDAEAADQDQAAPAPEKSPATRNITDELLKESGYVKPAADPYVARTDFFA